MLGSRTTTLSWNAHSRTCQDADIAIPYPHFITARVGATVILRRMLIVVGLFARLAAVPMIVVMIVGLISTKLPILLGHEV